MKNRVLLLGVVFCVLVGSIQQCVGAERTIGRDELLGKMRGFWIGQLVGNYMGFPFETCYVKEPIGFLVERYYTHRDDASIVLNRWDLRGYIPVAAAWLEGAPSDDDTDIEFVTLHAVEKFGLDINYEEITQMWKKHINRKIWVANRTARSLMDKGLVPPETGKKENNKNWFQIDPQLVNEIWSAFYPGMTEKAAARALWGARITNDDWGTHPTIAYGVMYSAAFFEKDVEKLVQMAQEAVGDAGPFAEGMGDVVRWHKQYPNWRDCRKKIHEKYWAYEKGDYKAPVSVVSSLVNGLCGIMAVLYGEGDFMKTTGIAVSAGYDCDNQAATCAGLMGVLNGEECIPDELSKTFLLGDRKWEKPFNDQYINFTRDDLPICNKISDIAERIGRIAEKAILENGGKKTVRDGKVIYVVNCDF
ncbi:MAG: ADP-ribosylglycohydrolase family protein [Sedimentisphaerales bacterium]|nr:ADP-ribosylglycohydrolase family protein [Sedimentisphaerales bacterium]